MSTPLARFTSSRRYLWMGLFATGGMLLSAWIALRWAPSWEQLVHSWLPEWWSSPGAFAPAWFLPGLFSSRWFGLGRLSPVFLSPAFFATVLFGLPAGILIGLAFRPPIEIHDKYLKIGAREIGWTQILRLDQTGWNVPLAVYLTIRAEVGEHRFLLVHAGDYNSCTSLLRYLRRYAREALLDGIPYREAWGEPVTSPRKQLAPPRYQLLLPEEEEEVERMFQRLKTVGHLDQRDEK